MLMEKNIHHLHSQRAVEVPGPANQDRPKVLYQAIMTFVPSLRAQTYLIAIIKVFVFSPVANADCVATDRQELQRTLKASLEPAEQDNLEIFMTILDGMKEAVIHYQLHTPQELDELLQARKDSFFARWCSQLQQPARGKYDNTK